MMDVFGMKGSGVPCSRNSWGRAVHLERAASGLNMQDVPALCLRSPINYLKNLANITLPEQDANRGVREGLALLSRTILKEICERNM